MTKTKNKVFIATSLDGFIADREGNVDYLHAIPNPNYDDMGYESFISSIDAIVMGRTTYETVLSFGIDWPYEKPVFVLSNTLTSVPQELTGKVEITKGNLNSVLTTINTLGYNKLYIDGGKVIQGFLKEDLIDEMIITVIPILLGGGTHLFGELAKPLNFECLETTRFLEKVVQNRFVRVRN